MQIKFGQCSAFHATLAPVFSPPRPSDWLALIATAWSWPGSLAGGLLARRRPALHEYRAGRGPLLWTVFV